MTADTKIDTIVDIIDHHYREAADRQRKASGDVERMYHEGKLVMLNHLRAFIKELSQI